MSEKTSATTSVARLIALVESALHLKYSKPSGGIPASDLASGVIPTVPQMATDPDMADWTSGKTVDAAALKSDFTQVGAALDRICDNVDLLGSALESKAEKSEIPSLSGYATETWVEGKGYQTAQQVQTAIAPLQSKAITDTGGYYTTDTVEGALQEIGAELAGVNTLIGSGVIS